MPLDIISERDRETLRLAYTEAFQQLSAPIQWLEHLGQTINEYDEATPSFKAPVIIQAKWVKNPNRETLTKYGVAEDEEFDLLVFLDLVDLSSAGHVVTMRDRLVVESITYEIHRSEIPENFQFEEMSQVLFCREAP